MDLIPGALYQCEHKRTERRLLCDALRLASQLALSINRSERPCETLDFDKSGRFQ
jgi:hypothetical protein